MGYSSSYFNVHIDKWLRNQWLTRGGSIIEFGAQEFSEDEAKSRENVKLFLQDYGISEERINSVISSHYRLSVAAVYEALGINYTAIDVDGTENSKYFDLNSYGPADNWCDAFDFVNNEGTIEHLVNPINGFQVAHELLKVGGVARHSMPLTGWMNHGFVYPTPKFYAHLVGENGYELLDAQVQLVSRPVVDVGDPRFRLVDEVGRELSPDFGITDSWIWLTYRKRTAADFRIPADHVYSDVPGVEAERAALQERLRRDFHRYASHRAV